MEKKSEESFLRYVQRKTLNPFIAWERSLEYKQLLALLLESKAVEDMEKIYNTVSENAIKGDDKAVRLFLSIQKEIVANAKVAKEVLTIVEDGEKDDEDDGLILD